MLKKAITFLLIIIAGVTNSNAQQHKLLFRAIAFYTAKSDPAHISFVQEANKWFPKVADQYHFSYDSTNDWNNLNADFLSKYQLVIFLDTRPEDSAQRTAFQKYMDNGGAWIGFHFSAFALTPSVFPQNWDWYHNTFIGTGQYKSNTWRPTSAILRCEQEGHPTVKGLPVTFRSSPNEWYSWQNDISLNQNIKILLWIDSASFPLGTGPRQHEIWHSGYYPVAWTNNHYRMVYLNMGHNDIDYEHKTNKTLSFTFNNPVQNQFIINSVLWLGQQVP